VDNAAQLANALCKVIQTPETANRLAMLGRERARQFDLAHITDQWAALLG